MTNSPIFLIISILAIASLIITLVAPVNIALIVLALTVVLLVLTLYWQQHQLQNLLANQAQELAQLQTQLTTLSVLPTSPALDSASTTTIAPATSANKENRRNYRTYMGLSLTEEQPTKPSGEEKLYLGVPATTTPQPEKEAKEAKEAKEVKEADVLDTVSSETALLEQVPSLAVENFLGNSGPDTASLVTTPLPSTIDYGQLPSAIDYEQMVSLPTAPRAGLTGDLTLNAPEVTQSFLASEILNLQQMQQLPAHFQISAEDNSAPNRTLGFSSPLPAIGESEAPPPLTVEMPRPQSLTRQRRRYSTFAGLSFESPSGRLATGKLGQREKTTLAEVATPNGESKSLTKERQRYRTFAGFIGDNNAMMTNDSTANRKATIETPVSTTKNLPNDQVSNLNFNQYITGKTNTETGGLQPEATITPKTRRRYQTFMGLSLSDTPQTIAKLSKPEEQSKFDNNTQLSTLINGHCSLCNKEQAILPDITDPLRPGFCWYCGARFSKK
jgi:hypothetical protein